MPNEPTCCPSELEPNRRIRAVLEQYGGDLIFHDCGDLLTDMVRQFAIELSPAMMSLGSSRKLWEDAAVVLKDIVLFGKHIASCIIGKA